jgi:dihydroorotase
MELYAHVFESVNALDKLEAFASFYAADFYRLPRHTKRIQLVKQSWTVPDTIPFGHDELVPLWAGNVLSWKFVT